MYDLAFKVDKIQIFFIYELCEVNGYGNRSIFHPFLFVNIFLTENLRRSTDRDEVVIPIGNRFDKQVLFGKMIDESLVFVEQTVQC